MHKHPCSNNYDVLFGRANVGSNNHSLLEVGNELSFKIKLFYIQYIAFRVSRRTWENKLGLLDSAVPVNDKCMRYAEDTSERWT